MDNTYGCNECGIREDFDREIIWITSSYGLCSNCYDSRTEVELEMIRNEYE